MATTEEMKQAHDALDALDKSLHPEQTEEVVKKSLSIIDRLLSFAGVGEKLAKSEATKDEPKKEEEKPSAADAMAKSLANDQGYQEIRDGSEALKSLEEAVTKSIGLVDDNVQAISKAQGEQAETVSSLVKGLGLLAEATSAILKSLQDMPKSIPMSGYFGLPTGSLANEDMGKSSAISFEDTYLALEKGVRARILDPDVLAQFQSRPMEVLKSLSADTRTKLGIPTV